MLKSNSGLIPLNDFYNDPLAMRISSSGFNYCQNFHNGPLPKRISNLRGDPSAIYQSYTVSMSGK